MLKNIIYIIVLVLLSASVLGLDECYSPIEPDDLPCNIISTYDFNCSDHTVKIFDDFPEDKDDWKSKWIKYANDNLGISLPNELMGDGLTTEKELWIDSVVNAFCNKYKIKRSRSL